MKNNNYYWKEKEYKKLLRRVDDLLDQIRSSYVELEKPIRIGVQCSLVPRHDIQNRVDANVFWTICQFSTVSHSKNPTRDFWWEGSKKPSKYYNEPPSIRHINQAEYNSLSPDVQKWFERVYYRRGGIPYNPLTFWYACSKVPSFFFEYKYSKWYQTRAYIKLSDVESEYNFIIKRLRTEFREFYYAQYCAPKHFRKTLNRSERRKANIDTKMFQYDEDHIEYYTNYRGASWLWY